MTVSEQILASYAKEAEARRFFESLIQEAKREIDTRIIDALKPHGKVQLGLAVKGMKSWRATAFLFFNGFEEDAEIVLRSLLDVAVDMKFITLDPKDRAERFIEYEVVHRLRWLREGKKRMDLTSPENKQRLDRVEKQWQPQVDAVFKRRPNWKKRLPVSWADEDIATKIEKIGQSLLYLSYMAGSAQTHPNVAAVSRYFSPSEDAVDVMPDPRVPATARVFVEGCLFLHMVIDHLNDVMHLKLDNRCKASRDMVEALLMERLTKERREGGQAMNYWRMKAKPKGGRG